MARIKTSAVPILSLALSLILASLSVFIPVTILNRIELQQVRLGLPFHFIVQNQVGLPFGFPDAPPFPVRQVFLSPWEYPFQIIWWRYLLDVVILFSTLSLVYLAARFVWRRAQPGV